MNCEVFIDDSPTNKSIWAWSNDVLDVHSTNYIVSTFFKDGRYAVVKGDMVIQ